MKAASEEQRDRQEVYGPPAPFADSFDLLIRQVDVSIGEDHGARLTIRVIVCCASSRACNGAGRGGYRGRRLK